MSPSLKRWGRCSCNCGPLARKVFELVADLEFWVAVYNSWGIYHASIGTKGPTSRLPRHSDMDNPRTGKFKKYFGNGREHERPAVCTFKAPFHSRSLAALNPETNEFSPRWPCPETKPEWAIKFSSSCTTHNWEPSFLRIYITLIFGLIKRFFLVGKPKLTLKFKVGRDDLAGSFESHGAGGRAGMGVQYFAKDKSTKLYSPCGSVNCRMT